MSLRVKTLGPSKLNPITSETQTHVSREATQSLLNRVGFDLKVFNLKGLRLLRKEVIQPQVPLRLPCYDFAPVTALAFGGLVLLAKVPTPTSGARSFHGVTGGVYKARERIHRCHADQRLLAIPTSKSRVADSYPY